LQKGKHEAPPARETRVRAMLAGLCAIFALATLTVTTSRPMFYAGYAAAIGAAVLLGPLATLALARTIRPLLKWLRPVEGALAADSLVQSPRRTSASVAALMLSLALVVAFSGMARASVRSIVDWMNTSLNPDLFVLPSPSLDIQTIRFPATMGSEIAALPGIQRVQAERDTRITFRKKPVMIVALDVSSIAETDRRQVVAGNEDEMYRKASAGEGVMVSDNLAGLQKMSLGEVLEIPAPYGVIHVPIVGIIVDYSDQQGAILMDRSLFLKYWHDDSASAFRVFVERGTEVAEARQRIVERYAGRRRVFVLTNTELKNYILNIVDQWFSLTSVQIAVAVLVGILGILNTLTVSITDRRRELGVLQAVGALRPQIRYTIWMEALGVAAIGLILGCALGAINLYYILQIAHRDIIGMRLNYEFPVSTALMLVPIILLAAFTAAIWPAESAVRGSLVAALEYE